MKIKLFNMLLPEKALAVDPTGYIPEVSISTTQELLDIVNTAVRWAFGLFFALAAVFILWAAFDYLTAGGDPKKIDSAKNKLIYAAIGIGIALIARSIVAIVGNFLT